MADLIPCARCPRPALWLNYNTHEHLCDRHDDGFNEPMGQAWTLPYSAEELAKIRRWLAAEDERTLYHLDRTRLLLTLAAAEQERDEARANLATLRAATVVFQDAEAEFFAADGNVAIIGADEAMERAKRALFALLPDDPSPASGKVGP